MHDEWTGPHVASVTPFDKSGNIELHVFAELLRFQLAQGVAGCFVGGATGEGIHLTSEELLQLFETAVEVSQGMHKVIGHVGGRSTRECVRLACEATRLGVDAIGCMLPLVYSYDFAAVERHFRAVADATALPILVYWLPSAGRFDFTDHEVKRLFSVPNIMLVKYSGSMLHIIKKLTWLAGNRKLHVFTGDDKIMLGGFVLGACGHIGTTANFMPHLHALLFQAFVKGDMRRAQELQEKALRLLLLGRGSLEVVSSCKAIVGMMEFDVGGPRGPLRALNESEAAALKQRLVEIGYFADDDYVDWTVHPEPPSERRGLSSQPPS